MLREGRRGFDFDSFRSRLESLWFQRKAFLADGRYADAARQSELIRAFCNEEGIRRVEGLSSALIAESRRYLTEGSYEKALRSLDLAESFDPGRSQVRMARAAVYWKSGGGILPAASEFARAGGIQILESWSSLTLVNDLALVAVIALLGCLTLFALLTAGRYQVALRHEVAEALAHRGHDRWGGPAGWAALLLPLVVVVAAGWAALYWIAAAFRYMRGRERWTATLLLAAAVCTVPAYRLAVAVYGLTADPVVRTTVAAASGGYDPDRIVKMRELVEAQPDEPIYRFLLAGLYKNGHYFEDAYDQYKKVLSLQPSTFAAFVNLGNIFFQTGQYSEAVGLYKRAIALQPRSILAHYNLHLAQSEGFDFKEAEATLNRARDLDARAIAELLSRKGREGDRPTVIDATVGVGTILRAILAGGRLRGWLETDSRSGTEREIARQFLNPTSVLSAITLLACLVVALVSRKPAPARRCTRCGRPFCHRCRSGREGHDYCTQCVHLFVLGDGLAPETKTRKLYEIERHQRSARIVRGAASLVVPGAGDVLRGRPVLGCVLMTLWLAAWIAWIPAAANPLQNLLGADLRLDLLRAGPVPASFALSPAAMLAIPLLVVVWLAGNLRRRQRLEA